MLICQDGHTIGSLSAGCLEEEVATQAQEVLRTCEPAMMTFDTRRRFGCNGKIDIFVERVREIAYLTRWPWRDPLLSNASGDPAGDLYRPADRTDNGSADGQGQHSGHDYRKTNGDDERQGGGRYPGGREQNYEGRSDTDANGAEHINRQTGSRRPGSLSASPGDPVRLRLFRGANVRVRPLSLYRRRNRNPISG